MRTKNLEIMFNPKTIAVIGATNKAGHVGNSLMKNILSTGYEGTIYPVNPNHKSVCGVKAYPSIGDIPDKIDLALIATPAATVLEIVDQCGKAGVCGVTIISAGFDEIGEQGRAMSQSILKCSEKYNLRILGPNCLGFIRPSLKLNASFANKMALPGKIAFISQSGALCTAILDWANDQNVGFSHFVSIGSMIDIGFHDLIDYFGKDSQTTSILIYMESLSNARKFLSAARAFARTKPIIILKAGKSKEGAQAARSHTGSLAGNDSVFEAAFKRAGVVRVNTIGELFDCAQTLAMQKRPINRRMAIITNAGGPGVIATDSLIEQGGEIAKLSDTTISKLNACLPGAWSHGNPVDVLGDADHVRYEKAVTICMDDDNVDGVLVILTPQAMTNPSAVAKGLTALPNLNKKPLFTAWMGESDVENGRKILKSNNIPVYRIPENAIRSFMNMYLYAKNLEILYEAPATIPHAFKPNVSKNKELISRILREKRSVMTEIEAKELLSNYEIPVTKNFLAKNEQEAISSAQKIGFPVVMKIASPDILHKTDVGGVKLNISSKDEVKSAYKEILASARKNAPKANIFGVFVEQMASKRYELLIGCKKDPIFGPVIVFGMGGVAVEIYKDTNVGLPPLNMALAMRIIEETKIYTLLKGYRGMKGVDISSIQFLLYKFAYLVMDFPEIKEIDINPFGVDEKGGIVLDAKVILDESFQAQSGRHIKPYSHMVISPYPKEYVREIVMANGKKALFRPIRPEDEPLEAEMFRNFSKETQRFRFFTQIKDITHELLVRYTQIDYDREIAIIAEVDDKDEKGRPKKKMAGVVRLVADNYNETAEFAIVVADPWHNLGIGNAFTDYVLEIAKHKHIQKIYAEVLKDNNVMLHMFRKRGFKMTLDDDIYHAELELEPA